MRETLRWRGVAHGLVVILDVDELTLTGQDAMTPSFVDYANRSFVCPPTWRWQRACWHADHGRNYSRRRDDADTARAIAYVRAVRCGPEGNPRLGRGVDRTVHAARLIAEQDDLTTLIIQARILARQTSREIAEQTGIDAAVIDAYEALFYSCRPRLIARDWVQMHALAPTANVPVAPERAVVLKQFAYYGGPAVLDAVMPYLIGEQNLFESAPDLASAAGLNQQSVRLAIATQLLPCDEKTNRTVHKLMLLLREREQNRPLDTAQATVLATYIDSALASGHFDLPFEPADETSARCLAAADEVIRQAA